MEHEIICLGCPNGCHLLCTSKPGGAVDVTGNTCDRGADYGREELLEPKRTVTAVVRTDSPRVPWISVKTTRPLAKPLIPELLEELYRATAALPARRGDRFIENFRNTGVDVVFTRTASLEEAT